MRYLFMNKNKILFEFNYNENQKRIDNILNIGDENFFPISVQNAKNNDELINKFYDWLNIRYSKNSSWYKKVEWKYGELKVDRDFIIKSYGLSLSDQYWIKPSHSKEKWEDVNFFDNNFKYQPFIKNNLERVYDYKDVDVLYSPNITTGGDLDKAWAIEDGKRVLYKSSNTFLGLEPINEFVSSKICDILDVSHADYKIKILSNLDKKMMVSSCETFIDGNTELIPASYLVELKENPNEAYNKYLDFLSLVGIENSKSKVQKMLLVDAILNNHDRHLNNFGVIRNVNTLEFVDVAPIFDTGRSMNTEYPPQSEQLNQYCLFTSQTANKQDILKLIKGMYLSQNQVDKLKEIPNLYQKTLEKYYDYTNLSLFKDDIKENLVNLLKNNINESLEYIRIIPDKESVQDNGDIDI